MPNGHGQLGCQPLFSDFTAQALSFSISKLNRIVFKKLYGRQFVFDNIILMRSRFDLNGGVTIQYH